MNSGLQYHHIGFAVENLQLAINKWENDGFKVAIPPVDDLNIGVSCVMLTDVSSFAIEIISPLSGSSSLSARMKRGGGLDHICFSTENIDQQLQIEQINGAIVVLEPTVAKLFNRKVAFVIRRSGLLTEFIENGEVSIEAD